MTDRITLTEEERNALDLAVDTDMASHSLANLDTAVESILSARVAQAKAEALRDAAKRLLGQEGHDVAFNKAKRDETPMQRVAHWMRDLANTYDPKSGDNE